MKKHPNYNTDSTDAKMIEDRGEAWDFEWNQWGTHYLPKSEALKSTNQKLVKMKDYTQNRIALTGISVIVPEESEVRYHFCKVAGYRHDFTIEVRVKADLETALQMACDTEAENVALKKELATLKIRANWNR